MNISFDEIKNGGAFEDLVADYFREVKKDSLYNIVNVEVQQSGTGADGGRDILIIFTVDDSISTFKRKWVVQCKFYKKDIN